MADPIFPPYILLTFVPIFVPILCPIFCPIFQELHRIRSQKITDSRKTIQKVFLIYTNLNKIETKTRTSLTTYFFHIIIPSQEHLLISEFS